MAGGIAQLRLLLVLAVLAGTEAFLAQVPVGLLGQRARCHAATCPWGLAAAAAPRPRDGAFASRCSAEAWRAEERVVIVGAGVAGMACAIELKERGIPFTLVEAAPVPGGRVRTDEVDGFLLDHGFQILLTSYPEVQRLLDLKQLNLRPFYAGALVRFSGEFHRLADPLRHPIDALLSLKSEHPIGSVYDKLLIGVLRLQSLLGTVDELYLRPDVSISERLSKDVFFGMAFSKEMIDRFLRPLLGGIFFDTKLRTTARELDFVFRMLALGENCLPQKGIRAVPDYMASLLPQGSLRLGAAVAAVSSDGSSVKLASGESLKASAVVVATDGPSARALLLTAGITLSAERESKKTMCLYYAIDGEAPLTEAVLYLNGDGVEDAEGTTRVNNMCFPSTVCPSYAPAGKSLASVSLVGIPPMPDQEVSAEVKRQLTSWFGPSVQDWKLLKTFRIPYCQPNQEPPTEREQSVEVKPFVFVTGDHRESASLEGAMRAGTRCGQVVSAALSPLMLAKSRDIVADYAKSVGVDISIPPFEPSASKLDKKLKV